LQCGHAFEVWGWGLVDGRWTCRKATVALLDELSSNPEQLAVTVPPRRKRRARELTLWGAA
jgi:hypothetical protein